MATLHIFGGDHFLQELKSQCFTASGIAAEQQQKGAFADTLRGIILENRIELIAEEGKLDRVGLGAMLAKELKLPRVELTMPIAEREHQGIYTPDYDRQANTRQAAYAAFEQYMFAQVKATKTKLALVVCGRRHLPGLARLFIEAGDTVSAYDINDYGWYLGVPQEGAGGVIGYYREQ